MVESSLVEQSQLIGPTPLVVGAPVGSLFGFYHPAEGPRVQPTGVVLCNPLGYEAMCTHRTYRHVAERLAARGFPALRFDYHGTGDSSGNADDPHRVHAWLESIDAAINELRQRAGVPTIAIFGVRFGATLAATVAARRGDVESLILWAPSASGRAYVRELRAFRMIKQPTEERPLRNGGEEAAGYHFDKTTISDLSEIDLFARKDRIAARALIVPRDDLPGTEERLAQHLRDSGVDTQLAAHPGYKAMMRDAQESVVPFKSIEPMIDWLEAARQDEAPGSVVPRSVRQVLVATSRARNVAVSEHFVKFGDGQRLFGIVAERSDGAPRPNRPAVILLNVGANHRVGPNRMYVSLSRDLASLGYVSFRFDVAGLGDSKSAPGLQENRLYSKDSLGDVKTAMNFLQERFGASRFVLVGLCSGAYLAFHTSIEDTRVVGQILLNPQTFEWKEGDSLELSMRKSFLSSRYYARALFSPAVWRRAIRGNVNVRAVLGVMRDRLAARTKAGLRSRAAKIRGKGQPQTEIEQAFFALCHRGVDSLLVFSFSDGGLDMIERHLGPNARKMRGFGNFRFEIMEGADHTFTPLDSQASLHRLLMRHITEHFG